MNTTISTLRTVVFAVVIGAPLSSSALLDLNFYPKRID
jgi:hypothetical protein